jgi:hypothetical protein
MPLTRDDYVAILRHLRAELRQRDPEAQALVAEYTERSDDPRRYLLDYLRTLIKILSERSSGAYGRVLNTLNEYVRTPEGRPIRGIRLELSPIERELYRQEQIDLAVLPDRDELIADLLSLYRELSAEGEEPNQGR